MRIALLAMMTVACAPREPAQSAIVSEDAHASVAEAGSAGSFDAGVEASVADAPTDARPDARSDAGRAWIEFDGPAFVSETPMHGGPAWSFATRLPARLRSGELVLPIENDRGLSTVPNMSLRFVDDRGRALRTTLLLAEKDFDDALRVADRRGAFEQLASVVRPRVASANAALDAVAPRSLAACTIDPQSPHAAWPPCAATQTIVCDGAKLEYLGGKQTLVTPYGSKKNAAWKNADVKTADGRYAVNECIGAAWTDGPLLVALFDNLCAVPGDWCSVPSAWRVIAMGKRDGG